MEPAPSISTFMRASLNWRLRCTHASLPPLALFIIPHAASRVSSQMITHRLRALKNPFSTKPFTCVNHHFLPTTSQSVFPVADQRLPFTSVWILRGSCGGNRRMPLTGESERVLPQRGHSTNVMPLSENRLRATGKISCAPCFWLLRSQGQIWRLRACKTSEALSLSDQSAFYKARDA